MATGDEVKADVREHGANQQQLDRRLFMQLQVLTGCADLKPLVRTLTSDETQKLSDATFNSTSKIRATAKPTQGAVATTQTSRTTAPTKKNDATAQPAATPRKSPSPAPTRR